MRRLLKKKTYPFSVFIDFVGVASGLREIMHESQSGSSFPASVATKDPSHNSNHISSNYTCKETCNCIQAHMSKLTLAIRTNEIFLHRNWTNDTLNCFF